MCDALGTILVNHLSKNDLIHDTHYVSYLLLTRIFYLESEVHFFYLQMKHQDANEPQELVELRHDCMEKD